MRSLSLALCLALAACGSIRPRPAATVKTGIDMLEENGFRELQGKRIGLITNHTGKDGHGKSTAEVLAGAPGVTLSALFSPEHGFAGSSEESAVSSMTLSLGARSIPVHSLFSGGMAGMRPKPEDIKDLDALVFDIQDIGARFYTYLATMGMALEEASKAGLEFIVLDRPNPINGLTIEGPVLDDLSLRQVTPTAYFPVPIRHGMTAGEIALLYNAEVKNPKLSVIKMNSWKREMWYDETGLPWTPPSPNIPGLKAAELYPGIGIFEASNLSVGRGTPLPFRWIGAPWLDSEALLKRMRAAKLEGVKFWPLDLTPAKSTHQGQLCHGLRIIITDRERLRPVMVFLELNQALLERHPRDFQWRWDELKRMAGTEDFHRLLEAGADAGKIKALFDQGPLDFEKTRKAFLLY